MNGGPKEFPTLHGFDEYLGFVKHSWDYIRLSEKDVEAYEAKDSFDRFIHNYVGPMLEARKQGTIPRYAVKRSYENDFTTNIFTRGS